MKQYLQLARHGRFRLLLAGQVLSLFGDALFPMIVVTAIAHHATGFSVAAVFAARAVTLGALVLLAGSLIDRVNPIHAMVAVNAIRCATLAAFALTWNGHLGVGALLVAVVVGACEAVGGPALLVVAPTIAETDAQGSGAVYALVDVLRHGATVVGPVAAAAIAGFLGVPAAGVLAAVLFGMSSVATRWAGARITLSTPGANDAPQTSLGKQAAAGLSLLWKIKWIRTVECLSMAHVLFAVGPWTVLLPTVILTHGSTASYGMLLSMFAVGAVAGAFIGGHIKGSHRGVWAIGLLSLFGWTAAMPGISSSLPVLVVAFVFGGIGQEACDVVKMSAMRTDIPEEFWGRAFAADFFFSFAALPLGQLLGAGMLAVFDSRTVLVVSGAMVVATSLLTLLSASTRQFADGPVSTAVRRQ